MDKDKFEELKRSIREPMKQLAFAVMELDLPNDLCYVRLRKGGKVHRTVRLLDEMVLDYAADDTLLGIEVLSGAVTMQQLYEIMKPHVLIVGKHTRKDVEGDSSG